MLKYHYVEDFKFYRIDYILNGYFHRIQLSEWNVDCPMPEFIAKSLRAVIACEPEEMVFR